MINVKKLGLFIVLQMCLFPNGIKGDVFHDRDFHGYHPPEYQQQPLYYPPNYHEEHTFIDSPVPTLMNKGLNFLAVKLGVLGIVKGVVILLFSLFVLKLPVLIFKMLLIKSLFLPVVGLPLIMYYYMNYVNQPEPTEPATQKPIIAVAPPVYSTPPAPPTVVTTTSPATNGSRSFKYTDPMFLTWESIKMFAENDQCLERIYCSIGATHEDSYLGTIFYRALKFLNDTSPQDSGGRIPSLMKAYGKGKKTHKCSTNDFKCQPPEIVLQQGLEKVKVL